MAGRMASDMTTRLSTNPQSQIAHVLYHAATDPELKSTDRAELADVLDLFWCPAGLFDFVTIPQDPSKCFIIGKYPVTNAQYARFLRSENFDERGKHLWCDMPKFSPPGKNGLVSPAGNFGNDGWDWLQNEMKNENNSVIDGVIYPRYWRDARFGQARPHAPVVGVSWWEANAYARWLLAHWEEQPEGQQGPAQTQGNTPAHRTRMGTGGGWQRRRAICLW